MTKEQEFHYADFTEENYHKLLQIALKGYTFVSYPECAKPGRNILWRHDVDHSIHRALRLAQIEHSLGVQSTFFIYTHSAFYNLFELEVAEKVKEIIKLGHHIGLHADHGFYVNHYGSTIDVEQCSIREKQMIEDLFACEVAAVSFHQPSYRDAEGITGDYYAGMVNAYSESIFARYSYCSDSNGYWRFRRLEEVLQDESIPALQVLTHPSWWAPSVLSPAARIKRTIDGRAQASWQLYCQELDDCGRENIGKEDVE